MVEVVLMSLELAKTLFLCCRPERILPTTALDFIIMQSPLMLRFLF